MRHNSVFLCGRVIETSEIGCKIETIRGKRNFGGEKFKKDIINIMTVKPDIITEIKNCKENDIVIVKGVLKTTQMNTLTRCSHCKEENIQKLLFMYIDPFYFEIRNSCESKKEAENILQEYREISNQITIGGTLLTPPQNFIDKNGVNTTIYNISNRDEVFSVKSFGTNATNDANALNKGDLVFVDGFLANRKRKYTNSCPNCVRQYNWTGLTLEIVPYTTEYI